MLNALSGGQMLCGKFPVPNRLLKDDKNSQYKFPVRNLLILSLLRTEIGLSAINTISFCWKLKYVVVRPTFARDMPKLSIAPAIQTCPVAPREEESSTKRESIREKCVYIRIGINRAYHWRAATGREFV